MLNAYLWMLVIASFVNLILYAYDKHLADNHKPRLSEFYMIVTTALGGTFGAVLGIIFFNHKSNMSKKWYFLIGLLAASNLQTLLLLLHLGFISI